MTATSSGPNYLCNTTVGGSVTVQQSGAGATWQIGPTPGSFFCSAGLTIGNNLTVQSNAGRVDVGGNTTQTGNITVQSNTGGGTLIGNSAHTNCKLSGDVSPIAGSGNTAGGLEHV